MTILYFFKLISLFLFIGYLLFIMVNTFCWLKIKKFDHAGHVGKTMISVVIAMRNEETNIRNCIDAILHQNYPSSLFEIIIVDDHSSDQSVIHVKELAVRMANQYAIKLIELHGKGIEKSYKKTAISEGIKLASGELIVTTDADCKAGKNWLTTIAAFYEKHNPVLMMCPVSFSTTTTLFSKMQALEFAGLIGMGASSNKAGFPLMCNGANLVYSKKAFEEINGFGNTPDMASGDDTFLLFKMKEKYKNDIHFIKSLEADVITESHSIPGAFFQQRKRWASKTTRYNKSYITITGLLIFFFNAFVFASGILSIFFSDFLLLFVVMLSGKLIFEFIFMMAVCNFFKKENLLWSFLPTALLFIPYIVIIGIAAPFGKYRWKGRIVK